jgi:hypothetical protein
MNNGQKVIINCEGLQIRMNFLIELAISLILIMKLNY